MLTSSDAYDWNGNETKNSAPHAIDAIAAVSKRLVFEVGYPNEGFEWCARLPHYGEDWDKYVMQNILRDNYESIVPMAPMFKGKIFENFMMKLISNNYKEDSVWAQRIKSIMNIDSRDHRRIYFCE